MSFPVLSFPFECAKSTDLTVRHRPITVCDINRPRCATSTDLTVRHAPIYAADRKAVEAGIGTVMAILGGLAMGIIYLIASAMAYDPMLIAVLDDGRWICLGIWYE